MHLARAVAAQAAGQEHEARQSLLVAIRHARDERIIRPFLNHGAPMHSLLRGLVRRRDQLDPRDRQFALALIASFGLVESGPGSADPLLEPLTDRQRDILQLLADGHANREIAKHLSIAEGTVKAHLNQVFGKLGARNRTEAVATARQLGMLS
jgi:LuxR family maltose regulon positive regulatory protein